MIRYLLRPRQVALHALALVLVACMGWLCWWQFTKASDSEHPSAQVAAVPLEQLSRPGALPAGVDFLRPVQASGVYLPEQSVIITGRMLDARAGSWVITPLRLADGSVIAVARGWVEGTPSLEQVRGEAAPAPEPVSRGGTAAPVPVGVPGAAGPLPVSVSGQLLPPEQAPARPSLGPGQVAAVDLVALAPMWGNPALHEGFIVAATETANPTPGLAAGLVRIPATNAAISDTGAPFSNASYALQWLAFSGFVVFLWWRILRDGWRKQQATAQSAGDC